MPELNSVLFLKRDFTLRQTVLLLLFSFYLRRFVCLCVGSVQIHMIYFHTNTDETLGFRVSVAIRSVKCYIFQFSFAINIQFFFSFELVSNHVYLSCTGVDYI